MTKFDVRVNGKTYRSFNTRREAVESRNSFNEAVHKAAESIKTVTNAKEIAHLIGRAYVSAEL